MRRRLFPGDHPYVATGLNNLALILQERGDLVAPEALFRESLAMRRRLYPEGHVSIATDLNNLAGLLLERNEPAAAEPLYAEAAALYERTQGGGFWRTGIARSGLGRSLTALGRFAAAEPELLAGESILATAQGVPAGRHARSVEALAALYEAWEKSEPGRGHAAAAARWRARQDDAKAGAPAAVAR